MGKKLNLQLKKGVFMKNTAIAIFSACMLASGAYAMEGSKHHDKNKQQQTATLVQEVNVEKINDNYKDFIGKKVKVKGEVDDIVMEDRSFILEGNTWFGNDILVVSKGKVVNLKELADKESQVTITGTVKHANFYEVENDLNSALNPELELDKKKGVTYILLDDVQSGKMAE
tara:strand:+ start:164682 stop:165197 length:516 start_codon:yes stop_codon:yes gene_type:complete